MRLSIGMLKAFDKTVYAFEQTILDLEHNDVPLSVVAKKWGAFYEDPYKCYLCKAAGPNESDKCWETEANCHLCILGPEPGGCIEGKEASSTFGAIADIIYGEITDTKQAVNVFKKRLKYILKRLHKHGYEMVEA